MEWKQLPFDTDGSIMEVRYGAATEKRKAFYNVVINTPYGMVGGYIDGDQAPVIFEDAKRLKEAGGKCRVRLLPSWRGQGNEKGFVSHMHKLEIVSVAPYDKPAAAPRV